MHMLRVQRILPYFCRFRGIIRQKQTIRSFRIEGDQNPNSSASMPGHQTDFRTNEIHVHTSSNGESLAMTYFFNGKQQLLTRPRFESVTRTLNRLLKFVKKSKSPKKNDPQNRGRRPNDASRVREDVVSCEIDLQYPDESNVEMSTFQNDHIVSGIFFTLDAMTFTFLRDPPVTRSMQLFPKAVVLMGYPLVLTISSEFADGVDCDWYSCLDNEEMTHVGTGEIFYPTDVCVGRRLKAVCTPWRWDTDIANTVIENTENALDHNKNNNHDGDNVNNLNNLKDVDGINRTEAKDNSKSGSSLSLDNTVLTNRNTVNKLQNDSRKRILGRPAVCYSAKKIFQPVSLSGILKVRKDFIELKRVGKEFGILGNDPRNVPQESIGDDSKSLRDSNDKSKDKDKNKNKNKDKNENENEVICTKSDVRSSNLLIDQSNLDNRKAETNNNIRGVKELRVMTFNTLAEPFAISNHAINNIYSYCHIDHLDTEYRAQLTGLELLSYDADVLCLQECDAKTFKSYYYPLLTDKGYDCHYTNKAGGVLEGCVTATKRKNLQVLRRIDLPLKNVLRNAPYLNSIYNSRPDLQDVLGGKLGTIVQITVCQSTVDPRRIVIFANTHLFFHPAAAFARLLQTDVIISTCMYVRQCIQAQGLDCFKDLKINGEDIIEDYNDNNNDSNNGGKDESEQSIIMALKKLELGNGLRNSTPLPLPLLPDSTPVSVSIMLLGDLNSTPETAVIEYFKTKQLSPGHEVWESINTFRWGARDRDSGDSSRRVSSSSSPANGLDIDGGGGGEGEGSSECNYESFDELVPSTGQGNSNSSSSSSSSSSRRVSSLPSLSHDLDIISAAGFPPHSNYTRDFKDVLDYIYIEPKHFKVVRVAPFPTEEVLSRNTALPSCAFPSDHLAVIVDLEFVD